MQFEYGTVTGSQIKMKTGATYEKLERRGSKLPEQLKMRAKKVKRSNIWSLISETNTKQPQCKHFKVPVSPRVPTASLYGNYL